MEQRQCSVKGRVQGQPGIEIGGIVDPKHLASCIWLPGKSGPRGTQGWSLPRWNVPERQSEGGRTGSEGLCSAPPASLPPRGACGRVSSGVPPARPGGWRPAFRKEQSNATLGSLEKVGWRESVPVVSNVPRVGPGSWDLRHDHKYVPCSL